MLSGRYYAFLLLTLQFTLCASASPAVMGEDDVEETSHERMVRILAEVGEDAYRDDPFFGRKRLLDLRARRESLGDEASADLVIQLDYALATQELIHGNNERAVEHFENAYDLLDEVDEKQRERNAGQLTYMLAVACMRLGETQNCVTHHTSESCLLPIQGGGVHREEQGSRRAIRYLTEVLETTEPDSDTHLGAKWLFNLAHMTLGQWPDGVPEAHRIAPEIFQSDAAFPRFHDVAPELGVNGFALAGGIAIEDYDGDGLLDLLVSTWDPKGQMRFYHHTADGGFEDRTHDAGLGGILGGLNLVHADYDSDGDVDVLVLRGGWLLGSRGQIPNSLLQNQGPEKPGYFRDVTFEAGLADVSYPSQTGDWADYDLDGDLDLYIGNEATANGGFPSQLFQNRGDGTFMDEAMTAGVMNMRMAKGVSWGDIDGDRDPDLFVSNYMDANRLYLNAGDGTFTDVAAKRGVMRPRDSFPAWFWDFDNDGALDIYVASYYQSTGEARIGPVVSSYLGIPIRQDENKLYRGDGQGNFQDVAQELGLDLFTVVMGASFGDLDNDGFPDMYLGTGYPFYDGLVPNVMYWNRRGKGFDDVTTAGGFGHLQKGHGISFADLDDDGDQDVQANIGGAYPGDAFGDALFENPGAGNHWLKVRLEGRRSNRSGIGARVRAVISEGGRTRSVYQTVGQHGSFGNSPFELHLGLGSATTVERLEVFWPVTGETQTFEGLPVDHRLRIVEGEENPEVVPVVPRPFETPKSDSK